MLNNRRFNWLDLRKSAFICATFGGIVAASGCSAAQSVINSASAQPALAQQTPATSTSIPTAPAVAKPTYLVQRGDVQDILDVSGRWEPRDQLTLSFPIAGQVRNVNIQRGATVSKGTSLADLQITNLENQLATAQVQLNTAITNLNSTSNVIQNMRLRHGKC